MKTPQVDALPGMTPLGMPDGPTDPPDEHDGACDEFPEVFHDPRSLAIENFGPEDIDRAVARVDSPAEDGERAVAEDMRRDQLIMESPVVSRIDTDTEVAWIAHFMIGDDWIFEARAYGDGSVDFDTRGQHPYGRGKGLDAFGPRNLLINHVRTMAEASIIARHSDGRHFYYSAESWHADANPHALHDIMFGLDGPAEMKMSWIDLGLSGRAPRLEAFDDSFPMLAKLAEIFIDLGQVPSLPPSFTIPQFIAFLKSHGFEDRTDREAVTP